MDPWKLVSSAPTTEPVYLANGYLGTSIPGDSGLLPASEPSRCYLRGVYERSDAEGVDHLAVLPCWNRLRYGSDAHVQGFRRELDLRHGLLTTWTTLHEARGEIRIEQRIFVSRADKHQAVIRLTVQPTFSGEVTLVSDLETPADSHLQEVECGTESDGLWLRGEFPAYGVQIAESLTFQGDDWLLSTESSVPGGVFCRLTAPMKAGESLELVQFVRVASSLEADDPLTTTRQPAPSYQQALEAHHRAWDQLWKTDIEIEGDPEAQQYARAALFYLWSTVWEGDHWSIAPMGLSSNGYNGHIFWDAELWMYPSLLVTKPELARSCVSYREHTAGPARRRAIANGYQGTQFPWEAAFTGEEMTPHWADTRDFQLHITADVAIGAWWYYLNSLDLPWLHDHGFPLMRECADFWVSRVEHNTERNRYEISDVVCADEYAAHVNNDAFTNAAVQMCLLLTQRAAELLGEPIRPEWAVIAKNMYVPYDPVRGIHIEYDTFDGQLTKQADVELLAYPLEYSTDREQVARDLDYYATVIDPDGPAMSFSIYAILSAQLGRAEDAYRYFRRSFEPNCRLPFWSFSETPTNDEYHFCTGIGGSLQALLFGFTGLRLRHGWFALQPILPSHWKALRLRHLTIAGAIVDIEIEHDRLLVRRRNATGDAAIVANRNTTGGWCVQLAEGTGKISIQPADGLGSAGTQRVQVHRGTETVLDMLLSSAVLPS